MIGKPPPSPPGSTGKLDLVELRIANLRRELVADADPFARAAVLYEIGSLYEHELRRVSDAVDYYARAQDAAPEFQPAQIAQLRIAERKRDAEQIRGLCAAQVAAAKAPAMSATALLDLGLRSSDWASLLREALRRSPNPAVPALILEWLAEAAGDRDAVCDALRAQAEHASDPALRAALWLDLASTELDRDGVDEALDALERACESGLLAWQARWLQRRTAREHSRWDVLVRATVAMAALLEAADSNDEPVDPLSLPVPDEERLPLATLLWQEAASCSARELEDPNAALRYLESALRLRPDDRTIRYQVLRLAASTDEDAAFEGASQWFRENAPAYPAFVAHEIRRLLAHDDSREAVEILQGTLDQHPDSTYARAALDVATIRAGSRLERARQLQERAAGASGTRRRDLLWRAAQVEGAGADSLDSAQSLYSEAAAEANGSRSIILREALGSALRAQQAEEAVRRCQELLACELDPEEHALLSFCQYDFSQNLLGSEREAGRQLREALEQPHNDAWAPQIARARAALSDDLALLGRAHERLASFAPAPSRAQHLCAAGQAYARARDWHGAERVLREALHHSEDDAYVLSLLDAVLREGGRPEDVVALARERSATGSSAALGELSLLLAGASAERSGNPSAARQAYEQALVETPESASAALALADLARLQGDSGARSRAYASLSAGALGGGVEELFALALGDSLAGQDGAGSSRAYEQALGHPVTASSAAASLLSTPYRHTTEDQRSAADEALADLQAPAELGADGFGAAFGALHAALEQEAPSAGDAWLELAAIAPTDSLRASTLLQGLRATQLALGEEGADEAFMRAQDAHSLATDLPDAAIAIDETLSPGDDPELRCVALELKLQHCEPLYRGAVDAAHARALVEANRGAEAVALLSAAVDDRPDDLALWETLRAAARQAEQWPLVAQACERLAPFVEGSLKADLLEEAAVVRLDCLEQFQQAEDLFRSSLEADPLREVAFRRLHDLLAAREDAEALEALVSARLELSGAEDRPGLLYERARLLRGFSDRPGALEVLDELFTSEPDHVGALALAAEVHVSLEHWSEAVDCLRRLAKSNIPNEQRRVAHLGAADFLETRLEQKHEALLELRAVDELGLADAGSWTRIGSIEDALGNPEAAIDAYREALVAEPTHGDAIAGLSILLDGEALDAVVSGYEQAVWIRIDAGELEAPLLNGLRDGASWRGQANRAAAVRAVELALGLAASDSAELRAPSDVSPATVRDSRLNTTLEGVLRLLGPALSRERVRSKKASPSDPVYQQLEALSERFGARLGLVGYSEETISVGAMLGRDGAIQWLVPPEAKAGLDPRAKFRAGRLAWAIPRGAARLLDDSPQKAAGTLAAALRTARCNLALSGPTLPAVEVKLRRAVRKAIHDLAGDTPIEPGALLAFARSIQRSADRAGLLATAEIEPALSIVLKGRPTLVALQSSARGLDLLRFWIGSDSPLWGHDA